MNNESDEDENTTPPPPTEEEKTTETPNDPPKKEPEPEPEPDNGLAERIETLEKEVSALKAMMDTLGFEAADQAGTGRLRYHHRRSVLTEGIYYE